MSVAEIVQSQYGAVAAAGLSSRNEGVRAVAQAFGYTAEQLGSIPAEANMGLSCGNPTAFASLKPGEVLVDLGSGGYSMCSLRPRRSGRTGRPLAST